MKKLIIVVAAMFCAFNANAQIQATTIDGKAVILNSNGTWLYINDSISTSARTCEDLLSILPDKMTGEVSPYG
jgi:hypothetical protein